MTTKTQEHCYLCGISVHRYSLRAGEKPPADFRTKDHVPPSGLFPSPKPSNLIVVPCCFRCNNQHSGFDERLRFVASTPFDRNPAGQKILDKEVLGGTLAKGRQMKFVEKVFASLRPSTEHPDLVRVRLDAHEFWEGMIRITKGLLCVLYPRFDYHQSKFYVMEINPKPFDEQLRLMAMLKQEQHFERGQGTFQCWHHVDETKGGGAWMLVFYECFGFFVLHANGPELERFES